jgi:glycosyltransferase involved in cell wall biosynthesis
MVILLAPLHRPKSMESIEKCRQAGKRRRLASCAFGDDFGGLANTGGLQDIVDDRVTGALAEPFEPASLAVAIRWVLEDPHRRRALGVC